MRDNRIHEFYPSVYPRRVWIVKKASNDQIKASFCERDGKEIVFGNDTGNEAACMVFPSIMLKENGKYGVLVVMREDLNVGQIAHEASHVALEIFNDVGACITYGNQEPYAYLVGWVADCIYQVKTGKFKD